MAGLITDATDEELSRYAAAIKREQDRRRTLATTEKQVQELSAAYAHAVEGAPGREYREGMVIGPGEAVVENGVEYRNTSGAFLPVPPSAFPLGYERTGPPDEEVAEFAAGEKVQPGDLRMYQGIIYQALQPHTTADHWPPDAAHSLWTRA